MQPVLDTAFTIVVGDVPVVTFGAKNFSEAYELAREEWLLADFARYRSNGRPLWDGKAKLSVRRASDGEKEALSAAIKESMPGEDLVLAFLVELDGTT